MLLDQSEVSEDAVAVSLDDGVGDEGALVSARTRLTSSVAMIRSETLS
jgi:hypothetical protein